jgi:hypothetical protein
VHLRLLGVRNVIVGVYERDAAAAVAAAGMPCWDIADLIQIDPKGERSAAIRICCHVLGSRIVGVTVMSIINENKVGKKINTILNGFQSTY